MSGPKKACSRRMMRRLVPDQRRLPFQRHPRRGPEAGEVGAHRPPRRIERKVAEQQEARHQRLAGQQHHAPGPRAARVQPGGLAQQAPRFAGPVPHRSRLGCGAGAVHRPVRQPLAKSASTCAACASSTTRRFTFMRRRQQPVLDREGRGTRRGAADALDRRRACAFTRAHRVADLRLHARRPGRAARRCRAGPRRRPRAWCDLGLGHQQAFDLGGADHVAAERLDEVPLAVGDADAAVRRCRRRRRCAASRPDRPRMRSAAAVASALFQ